MSQPLPVPNPQAFWTPRRFLLVLAALVLAIFPKVALGLSTFFFHDLGTMGYPGAFYFQRSFQHGEWPLWNPYSHCGVPFLAQMGAWYPANFLYPLLPLPWGLNFVLLAHLVLGGAGMFALTRRWGADGFGAGFAGLAYVFSGVSFSCFQWGNYIESLGWLPWVVLSVVSAWRTGGRWIAIAAIICALQVLTATPELTLMAWMFLAAFWFFELVSGQIRFRLTAGRVALVILLAAGITMVQMLPFFDLLAHSQRDTNYEQSHWAMPGWGWANLVVPLFHNYLSPQGNWFQHDQDFLMSYYPGLGVLMLAAAGVWLQRTRTAYVIAGAALIGWVLALGDSGHLYPLAKKIFPWIGIARFPVKFTILSAFLVPILSALAITKIQSNHSARTRRVLMITGGFFLILTAGCMLYGKLYPLPFDETGRMIFSACVRMVLMLALLAVLLWLPGIKMPAPRLALQFTALGLLLADLLTQSPGITPTLPGSIFAAGLWQANGKPAPAPGSGRIMLHPDAEQRLLFSYVADPQMDFYGKRLAEWYNLNLLDSLPKVNGAFTLRPAAFDQIEHRLYYTPGASCGTGLLDFLSVAWLSDPANPTKWFARTNYLPVITAGQRPRFADDPQALAAVMAQGFDPRTEVFLPESARNLVTATNSAPCTLDQVVFGQNQVSADVSAAAPTLVVLSETYYHLWTAQVDDQAVPILRANVAFQAVPIPAGHHHIRLVYRDTNLLVGGAISLVSILICTVIYRRQPRLENPQTTE